MIKIPPVVWALLLFTLSIEQIGAQNKDGNKPNIILIMADDLGYGDIGCYGSATINTPHLDKLAKEGIRFTDFHSNGANCTPTRAALLTGRYQQRSGLEGVIYVKGETRQVGLDTKTTTTLAEVMQLNGYATGIMGKWHLGYHKEFNPVHHGFDEFYGFVSGNIDYHSHYDNSGIFDWWHNLDTVRETGYTTDLITQHSIDFIQRHRQKPFFLYVPHEAPHVPFQGRNDPGYRFPDKNFSYYGPVKDRDRAFKEMIEVLDEGVGEIMRTLQENDLEDNTLVLFLSDNGGEKFANNGGLKGFKGSLWEGGHRVPLIARWKGKIEGGISDETLITMDLMPTILSVAGIPVPAKVGMDGVDFSKVLFSQSPLPQRALFWRYRDQKAVRKGPWKYIVVKEDAFLFNLDLDLSETTNLAGKYPGLVAKYKVQLKKWEKEIEPPYPMKTK